MRLIISVHSRVACVHVFGRGGLHFNKLPFKLVEFALGKDLVGCLFACKSNEAKAPRAPRVMVLQDLALRDLAELLEVFPEVLCR